MRILLISHWYKPVKSPVKRMVRIAEYLAKIHDITVLTSLPSYPTGILPSEYQGKIFVKSNENKVNLIRLWDLPTPNKGFLRRTCNHIMFLLSASMAVFFMKPYELVIVSSPSFLSTLAGILAAKISGGYFIFDVRDLWPDSAFELGYKVNRFMKWFLKSLEKYFYNKAHKIFTATEEIRKAIIQMNISQEKIITLVNTVNVNIFRPKKISRAKFALDDNDFVIIYVGSLTQVQNLTTVIEAANLIKNYPNIKILLVGEGEDKENLINQTQDLKLKNIIFIGGQPTEKIIELINVSNLGLISLSTNKFFSDNALPTKTSEYLGCGKPIVACAGKNLRQLIEPNQAGIIVNPGNSRELAKAILKLYNNPKLLLKYSSNARKLAIERFSDKNFYQILDKNLL